MKRIVSSEESSITEISGTHVNEENRDGKSEKKENAGADRKEKLIGAALRLGICISRVFVDSIKRYNQDEDIVDHRLHYEIQAVKNGENPVM